MAADRSLATRSGLTVLSTAKAQVERREVAKNAWMEESFMMMWKTERCVQMERGGNAWWNEKVQCSGEGVPFALSMDTGSFIHLVLTCIELARVQRTHRLRRK